MNGTVLPWSVVVVATSDGGFSGSYAVSPPPPSGKYSHSTVGGWLHCASPAPDWQTHGCTCGPENTGPPLGWLVIVSVPVFLPDAAVRTLRPIFRPVTSPS